MDEVFPLQRKIYIFKRTMKSFRGGAYLFDSDTFSCVVFFSSAEITTQIATYLRVQLFVAYPNHRYELADMGWMICVLCRVLN